MKFDSQHDHCNFLFQFISCCLSNRRHFEDDDDEAGNDAHRQCQGYVLRSGPRRGWKNITRTQQDAKNEKKNWNELCARCHPLCWIVWLVCWMLPCKVDIIEIPVSERIQWFSNYMPICSPIFSGRLPRQRYMPSWYIKGRQVTFIVNASRNNPELYSNWRIVFNRWKNALHRIWNVHGSCRWTQI